MPTHNVCICVKKLSLSPCLKGKKVNISIRMLPDGVRSAMPVTDLRPNKMWALKASSEKAMIEVSLINHKNERIANLVLPNAWFQRDSIVSEWFPFKSPSIKEQMMCFLSIHIITNKAKPFQAPAGRLLVTPAWQRPNNINQPNVMRPPVVQPPIPIPLQPAYYPHQNYYPQQQCIGNYYPSNPYLGQIQQAPHPIPQPISCPQPAPQYKQPVQTVAYPLPTPPPQPMPKTPPKHKSQTPRHTKSAHHSHQTPAYPQRYPQPPQQQYPSPPYQSPQYPQPINPQQIPQYPQVDDIQIHPYHTYAPDQNRQYPQF